MSRLEKLVEAAERDARAGHHSLTIMSLIEPRKKQALWAATTDDMYCWHILECVTSL